MPRSVSANTVHIVLGVLICFGAAPRVDAQVATTCEPRAIPNMSVHEFGPFEIGQNKYTVLEVGASLAGPASGGASAQETTPDQTLVHLCVQGRDNKIVWERGFDRDTTSKTKVYGTAYEVEGQSGKGIVVETARVCAKRIPAGSFTVFAQRNGHLEVVAADVRFYGMMEHIPDAGPDRRRLVPGDTIRYQFWIGNYYLLQGVRVDFAAGTLVPLCSRKCAFSVMYQTTSPLESEGTVQLFNHPFGDSRSVAVRKQSAIEYVEAYVEDIAKIDSVRPWLHVRIDGSDGWMSEPADIQRVGLPEIARAD